MKDEHKPLAWVGSSKKDLLSMPTEVKNFFGHALDFAQRGIETPRQDMTLIRTRLKWAQAWVKEMQ